MKLQIVDGKRRFCGQIARTMRVEHHAALLKRGVSIHRELRRVFDLSYYSRAAFVDGHLAALWGMEGSIMSSSARVWLILSQYAVRFPIAIMRQARAELAYVAGTKTEVLTTLIPEDAAAHRLVAHLGFESPDGFGFGPPHGRRARGEFLHHLQSTPGIMHEHQVAVIWRRENQADV